MQLIIHNPHIQLCVDTYGAQMMSLKSTDGMQYLWQGDPTYWSDRSPLLFPFVGRLSNKRYRLNGREYPMKIHGFAAASEFAVTYHNKDTLALELNANAQTLSQYPFRFDLQIIYRLNKNVVEISYRVTNRDTTTMPFGIGGHPGFCIPLKEGERFCEYEICFAGPCRPERVGFAPSLLIDGHDHAYPLRSDMMIALRHELFDDDAVVLKNVTRDVTLHSCVSGRGVRVQFPDFPYLGIWHAPRTDAPYVCIEPWTSLPGRDGITEDFLCRSDLIQLAPNDTRDFRWNIEVL